MDPDHAFLFFIKYPLLGVVGYVIGFIVFIQRPVLPFWIMYVFAGFLISVYYLDRRSDGVLKDRETWVASIVPFMSMVMFIIGTYYTLYLYRTKEPESIDY